MIAYIGFCLTCTLSPPSGCRDCLHRHLQQVTPKAGPGGGDHVHQGIQAPSIYPFPPYSPGTSDPNPSHCPCSPLRPVSYLRIQGTRAAPSLTFTATTSLALSTTLTPLHVSVASREGGMGKMGGGTYQVPGPHLRVLPLQRAA